MRLFQIALVLGCAGCVGLDIKDHNVRRELGESDVQVLQHLMAAGRLTARGATEVLLERVGRLDRSGPMLRSVIETNPAALADAARLDQERLSQGARGPLHGITILIKDNIDTAGPMLTTAGSLALLDSRPAGDAFVVTRLKAAGAVILGKANLSEWANYRGRGASSGWSARGGQTLNPYALDRNPGGSSSGSAVAVAAGLVTLAVGTETVGSIVSPASANGIVGIKPTLGVVSRGGVIPIAASLDTPGPMARTVTDAAILLTAMAGHDPADPATAAWSGRAPIDFSASLRTDALRGAKVGVLRQAAGFHSGVDAVFEAAVEQLRKQGAILVDNVVIPTQGQIPAVMSTVLAYEFKDGINRYLAARIGDGPSSLADLIAFNQTEHDREMAYFGQSLFLNAAAKGPLTEPPYIEALRSARELAGPRGIDAALAAQGLDVLVAPTRGPAWLTDPVNGDSPVGGAAALAPAVAGYPHVTVPMGSVHGLPVGLSFVGTAWSDARLIGYAYAYEQATRARVPPTFTPSLNPVW